MVICVIVSSAEGCEAIEEFPHNKLDWLRQFIDLENGVPSHDGIAYVMSRVFVKGFMSCSQAAMEQ